MYDGVNTMSIVDLYEAKDGSYDVGYNVEFLPRLQRNELLCIGVVAVYKLVLNDRSFRVRRYMFVKVHRSSE